jgi:hypothetical protein
MAGRLFRIVSICIGLGGALLVTLVAWTLISERMAYANVEITTTLLRAHRYDPSEHFKFSRACAYSDTFAPLESVRAGYKELNAIFPDSDNHWTVVLFDDVERTFRLLYVWRPSVRFDGVICSPKLAIRAKVIDGATIAEAYEK